MARVDAIMWPGCSNCQRLLLGDAYLHIQSVFAGVLIPNEVCWVAFAKLGYRPCTFSFQCNVILHLTAMHVYNKIQTIREELYDPGED